MVIHDDPTALELYVKGSIIVILEFYIQLYCWYASLKVSASWFIKQPYLFAHACVIKILLSCDLWVFLKLLGYLFNIVWLGFEIGL